MLTIYHNEVKFRTINGFLLDLNGITTLQPLKCLNGREYAVLDIRHNEVMIYCLHVIHILLTLYNIFSYAQQTDYVLN